MKQNIAVECTRMLSFSFLFCFCFGREKPRRDMPRTALWSNRHRCWWDSAGLLLMGRYTCARGKVDPHTPYQCVICVCTSFASVIFPLSTAHLRAADPTLQKWLRCTFSFKAGGGAGQILRRGAHCIQTQAIAGLFCVAVLFVYYCPLGFGELFVSVSTLLRFLSLFFVDVQDGHDGESDDMELEEFALGESALGAGGGRGLKAVASTAASNLRRNVRSMLNAQQQQQQHQQQVRNTR